MYVSQSVTYHLTSRRTKIRWEGGCYVDVDKEDEEAEEQAFMFDPFK